MRLYAEESKREKSNSFCVKCDGYKHMERKVRFSVLVVSLNAGEKLLQTVKSALEQSYEDYEIVVKDGGSKDNSVYELEAFLETQPECAKRVRIIRKRDTGIYEGMDQATLEARGEYYYFLNCGDLFVNADVLKNIAASIDASKKKGSKACIYYGDIFDALRSQTVASNPHMDDFACYRNVPCHQACIYHYSLFAERGYNPKYRVRADYEHFLWCYFKKDAQPEYIPVVIASYEGGGFSETKENRAKSAEEHKEITRIYMTRGKRFRFKAILLLTMAPLRTKMAESPKWSGLYNKCKKLLYGIK